MSYRIVYEQTVPPGHPMAQKDGYLRRLELRERCCVQLQQRPVPPGHIGFIVEVNVSQKWCVERPQRVLGSIEERVRLRLKSGSGLQERSKGLEVVREEVFEEYISPPGLPLLTVYTDERLDIEVAKVEPTGGEVGANHPSAPRERHDEMRYHQRKRIKMKRWQRFNRQRWDASEGRGRTFSTSGDLLPVSTTHRGQALWSHMLVRLIVPPAFPLALARSYYGNRMSFSTEEAFGILSVRGICYDVLFLP